MVVQGPQMKDFVGAIALVRGTLKGMSREAACELLARRRPLPGANPFSVKRYEYTQFSIVQAPVDLPDGDYTLSTEDHQELPVEKVHGLWLIQEAKPAVEAPHQKCA